MCSTRLCFRFLFALIVGITVSASAVAESPERGDSDDDAMREALIGCALGLVCSEADAEIPSDIIQTQNLTPTAYYIVYDLTGDGRDDVLVSANFMQDGKVGNYWELIMWDGDKPKPMMEAVSFPARSLRIVDSEVFGGPVIITALTGGGGTGVIMAFSFAGGKLTKHKIANYSNLRDLDLWPQLLVDPYAVTEVPCGDIETLNSEEDDDDTSASTDKEEGSSAP